MPLSEGISGKELYVSFLHLPLVLMLLLFYGIAGGLLYMGRKRVQWLLLVPFLFVVTWPFSNSFEQSDYLARYFSESRDRTLIEQVFQLQEQRNLNLEPKYKAMFDTSNRWQQMKACFQTLGVGWYLLTIISLFLPMMVMRIFTGRALYWTSYLAVGFMVLCSWLLFFSRDPYQFPDAASDAEQFELALADCNQRLAKNPNLAASDYYVARCAEAYNSFHNWSGPVAKIPEINTLMGDRNFIQVPRNKFKDLQKWLLPLTEIPINEPVEAAFQAYGKRHMALITGVTALTALRDKKYSVAASAIHALESENRLSSWIFLGYSAAQTGQTALATRWYNNALNNLGNSTVEANVYCSLGNAMIVSGNLQQARGYFYTCRELDSEMNYWAINGLGGS